MKYAVLLTLLLTGCAQKQRIEARPGIREHCREISVNAKTGETTVICPPQKKEK